MTTNGAGGWGLGAGDDIGLNRREMLAMLAAGALPSRERFERLVRSGAQQPVFFGDGERALMRVLADMIIPREETSGSATDAGSIEYIEFVLNEAGDQTKQAWHDGLRWFDEEAGRRFQQPFIQCAEPQRGQILDDVAFPARASEPFRSAALFFNRLRDLVGAAFFSSSMGVQDLGYLGNVFNPVWQGAPPEALAPLGLSYEEWDRRYRPPAAPRAVSPRRTTHRPPRAGDHE